MEDGKNSEAYDRISDNVMTEIGKKENVDKDPQTMIIQAVMKELQGGNIRVQPHILVPDFMPEKKQSPRDDDFADIFDKSTKAQKDKDNSVTEIMVGGVAIPVRFPKIDASIFNNDESGATQPHGIREGEWDFMKQAKKAEKKEVTQPDESEKPYEEPIGIYNDPEKAKARIDKQIASAIRMADALAGEAVPNQGGEHGAGIQQAISGAIRRTMLDLNTGDNDDEAMSIISKRTDLLTDSMLHPKGNADNDAEFKAITARIRNRLKTGENGGEIIKQEVQKSFSRLKFGAPQSIGTGERDKPQQSQVSTSKIRQAAASRPLKQVSDLYSLSNQNKPSVNAIFDSHKDDILTQIRTRNFKNRIV